MAYTVKRLAALAGVSVRTLHYYDEFGLLKPAFEGANGYRFYEEPQLLLLQQILFYRELGFELRDIQRVLAQPHFDRVEALRSHRTALRKKVARTEKLIRTIDRTIDYLKGRKPMKMQDAFSGFSPEVQAQHESYLVERFGASAKAQIAKSKKRVQNWTKADWERSGSQFNAICAELVAALQRRATPQDSDVQSIIRRHFEWLQQFWSPNRESYTGHAALIEDSDLRQAYEKHHPKLPPFTAAAIRTFAERELS